MRKLALLFLILALPLAAQTRETRGTLREASTICTEGSVPRTGDDGKLALSCLPTTVTVLPFAVANPVVSADSAIQWPLPNFNAGTITSVDCACRDTVGTCTVSVNFDARAKSAPLTPGTDLHTSEIVADEDNTSVTSFAGETAIAANQKLNMSISAVTGTPTLLECYVMVERN